MILDVKFLTQMGNAYRNDCGAACFGMVSGQAIEPILQAVNKTNNEYLNVGDLLLAGRKFDIAMTYVRPLHLNQLRQEVMNGHPFIVLVAYGQLAQQQKAVNFNGNHWVVVMGVDDAGFYVNDPLWPDERGLARYWPDPVMGRALAKVAGLPMQGIRVDVVFPEMGTMIESQGTTMSQQVQIVEAFAKLKGKLGELNQEIAKLSAQYEEAEAMLMAWAKQIDKHR